MKNNISKTVQQDLCFQCGTCAAICESIVKKSAIKMELIQEKGYIYPKVNEEKCISCGLCKKKCPILNLKIEENHLLNTNDEIGVFTTGEKERILSTASGGMVTSILKYLLKENIVDKVIVAGYDEEYPTNTKGYIINDSSKIDEVAGSIYQPVSLNEALSKVQSEDRVAIVGLPCHIRGAELYFESFKIQNLIKISLICTIGRGKKGTEAVLEKYVGRNKKINKIKYRAEEHPGNFIAYLESKKIKMPFYKAFQHIDYLYMPKGCLYCPDIFGDYADITVGDPWGLVQDKKAMGIGRTELGKEIIKKSLEKEYIKKYFDLDYKVAMKTQKSGVAYKVYNYFKRLEVYRKSGCQLPYKDIPKVEITFKEKLWFKMLLSNSKIFNSKIGPKLTKYIPHAIMLRYRNKVAFENSKYVRTEK